MFYKLHIQSLKLLIGFLDNVKKFFKGIPAGDFRPYCNNKFVRERLSSDNFLLTCIIL